MGIQKNLAKIKEQIGNINVKIIAVTKYASEEQLQEAYRVGINNFGESYVQDALEKLSTNFPGANSENPVQWHFIGRLQKNKVKSVVGRFFLIHSVDSSELAEKINEIAEKSNIIQNVLLQVNISGESSKAGFLENELKTKYSELNILGNLRVLGLMTIAPKTDDGRITKDVFNRLKELKDELNKKYGNGLKELSMGMSNDYKMAVQCGATMLRIGRAIFNSEV